MNYFFLRLAAVFPENEVRKKEFFCLDILRNKRRYQKTSIDFRSSLKSPEYLTKISWHFSEFQRSASERCREEVIEGHLLPCGCWQAFESWPWAADARTNSHIPSIQKPFTLTTSLQITEGSYFSHLTEVSPPSLPSDPSLSSQKKYAGVTETDIWAFDSTACLSSTGMSVQVQTPRRLRAHLTSELLNKAEKQSFKWAQWAALRNVEVWKQDIHGKCFTKGRPLI